MSHDSTSRKKPRRLPTLKTRPEFKQVKFSSIATNTPQGFTSQNGHTINNSDQHNHHQSDNNSQDLQMTHQSNDNDDCQHPPAVTVARCPRVLGFSCIGCKWHICGCKCTKYSTSRSDQEPFDYIPEANRHNPGECCLNVKVMNPVIRVTGWLYSHPFWRIMCAVIILLLNGIMYIEDPQTYSNTKVTLPLIGPTFNFCFKGYPNHVLNAKWLGLKITLLILVPIVGMLTGEYVIRRVIFQRLLNLRGFKRSKGLLFCAGISLMLGLWLASVIYSVILSYREAYWMGIMHTLTEHDLKNTHVTPESLDQNSDGWCDDISLLLYDKQSKRWTAIEADLSRSIPSNILPLSNGLFSLLAFYATLLGDCYTLFSVTDYILQDLRHYKGCWMVWKRTCWPRVRIPFFWIYQMICLTLLVMHGAYVVNHGGGHLYWQGEMVHHASTTVNNDNSHQDATETIKSPNDVSISAVANYCEQFIKTNADSIKVDNYYCYLVLWNYTNICNPTINTTMEEPTFCEVAHNATSSPPSPTWFVDNIYLTFIKSNLDCLPYELGNQCYSGANVSGGLNYVKMSQNDLSRYFSDSHLSSQCQRTVRTDISDHILLTHGPNYSDAVLTRLFDTIIGKKMSETSPNDIISRIPCQQYTHSSPPSIIASHIMPLSDYYKGQSHILKASHTFVPQRGCFGLSEYGRVCIASLILVMNIILITQDIDFPHYRPDLSDDDADDWVRIPALNRPYMFQYPTDLVTHDDVSHIINSDTVAGDPEYKIRISHDIFIPGLSCSEIHMPGAPEIFSGLLSGFLSLLQVFTFGFWISVFNSAKGALCRCKCYIVRKLCNPEVDHSDTVDGNDAWFERSDEGTVKLDNLTSLFASSSDSEQGSFESSVTVTSLTGGESNESSIYIRKQARPFADDEIDKILDVSAGNYSKINYRNKGKSDSAITARWLIYTILFMTIGLDTVNLYSQLTNTPASYGQLLDKDGYLHPVIDYELTRNEYFSDNTEQAKHTNFMYYSLETMCPQDLTTDDQDYLNDSQSHPEHIGIRSGWLDYVYLPRFTSIMQYVNGFSAINVQYDDYIRQKREIITPNGPDNIHDTPTTVYSSQSHTFEDWQTSIPDHLPQSPLNITQMLLSRPRFTGIVWESHIESKTTINDSLLDMHYFTGHQCKCFIAHSLITDALFSNIESEGSTTTQHYESDALKVNFDKTRGGLSECYFGDNVTSIATATFDPTSYILFQGNLESSRTCNNIIVYELVLTHSEYLAFLTSVQWFRSNNTEALDPDDNAEVLTLINQILWLYPDIEEYSQYADMDIRCSSCLPKDTMTPKSQTFNAVDKMVKLHYTGMMIVNDIATLSSWPAVVFNVSCHAPSLTHINATQPDIITSISLDTHVCLTTIGRLNIRFNHRNYLNMVIVSTVTWMFVVAVMMRIWVDAVYTSLYKWELKAYVDMIDNGKCTDYVQVQPNNRLKTSILTCCRIIHCKKRPHINTKSKLHKYHSK